MFSVHIKGVSRMNFPCDVTVTVCGPVSNEEQRNSLHAVESFFSGLPSGYETASVLLSSQSPVAKQLTVRASREAFVSKHDLASVRWLDESFVNGRNTVKVVHSLFTCCMQQLISFTTIYHRSGLARRKD